MPLQVYPYSGVLLIALFTESISEAGDAKSSGRDVLIAIGLCLVGIQQKALGEAFGPLVHSHRLFLFMNPVCVLLLAGAALMASAQRPIQPNFVASGGAAVAA